MHGCHFHIWVFPSIKVSPSGAKIIFDEEGRWKSKLKLSLVDSKVCLAAIGSSTTFMNHRTIIVKLNSKSLEVRMEINCFQAPKIVSGEQSWAHRISIEAIIKDFYTTCLKKISRKKCFTRLGAGLSLALLWFLNFRGHGITEARRWKNHKTLQ